MIVYLHMPKNGQNKARRVGERFNDGKVDPLGCYWAGTLCRDASEEIVPKAAKLYRRYGDGAVKMVMEELSISNGAWDYEWFMCVLLLLLFFWWMAISFCWLLFFFCLSDCYSMLFILLIVNRDY